MNDRCLSLEELTVLALAAPDDPRRAHLDACPRCSARLLSWQEFLTPAALPTAARAEEAGASLDAALRREILEQEAPRQTDRAWQPKPSSRRRGILSALLRPAYRPAWAIAALAVVVVFAFRGGPGLRPGFDLRGGSSNPEAPVPAHAQARENGVILLEWTRPPAATSSTVLLHAADLTEVARIDAGAAVTLEIRVGEEETRLPLQPGMEARSRGQARFWRVLCLAGTEEIARSTLQELPPR